MELQIINEPCNLNYNRLKSSLFLKMNENTHKWLYQWVEYKESTTTSQLFKLIKNVKDMKLINKINKKITWIQNGSKKYRQTIRIKK